MLRIQKKVTVDNCGHISQEKFPEETVVIPIVNSPIFPGMIAPIILSEDKFTSELDTQIAKTGYVALNLVKFKESQEYYDSEDPENGEEIEIDCTKFGSGAYSVPISVEHLKFKTNAKFIMAIETAGMFQRLVKHKYWKKQTVF